MMQALWHPAQKEAYRSQAGELLVPWPSLLLQGEVLRVAAPGEKWQP